MKGHRTLRPARWLRLGALMYLALPLAPALQAAEQAPADSPTSASVFARENLVAWCIVPFDAKRRGPEQRAEMLQRLGIRRLAYDWRDEHIATFDAELDALARHGVTLDAFWTPCSLEPAKDKHLKIILDFLRRRKVKTQLWLSTGVPEGPGVTQEQKVAMAARAIEYVAREAGKIGCSVGLYNHGGWFGEPDNQIAILERVHLPNVGIVYNFHHGHEHLDRFPELFKKMQPYLLAVNLNGMLKDGPRLGKKILPLAQGDQELGMLRIIGASGYRGLIGILNHREQIDAEQGLKENLDGLKKLLTQMGDTEALKTFR